MPIRQPRCDRETGALLKRRSDEPETDNSDKKF